MREQNFFSKKTKTPEDSKIIATPKRYPRACRNGRCCFFDNTDEAYRQKKLKILKEQATDILLILSSFLSGACLFVLLHSHLITVFSPWLSIVVIPLVILAARIIASHLRTEEPTNQPPKMIKK